MAAAKDKTPDPSVASDANPTGQHNVSTGQVGTPEVIDAQEHVLGDDPRRMQAQTEAGYHDSLSGRPVDETGRFTDNATLSEAPVEPHRIVANDWPEAREKIDSGIKREGNRAAKHTE